MNILFFRVTKKTNTKGKAPIYCRITLNGKRAEFSTGVSIEKNYWNTKSQLIKGSVSDFYQNAILTNFRNKLEIIYLDTLKNNSYISADQLKYLITTKTDVIIFSTLIEKFLAHLQTPEAMVKPGTIRTYKTRLRNIYSFLKDKNLLNAYPMDFNNKTLREFQNWLTIKKYSQNYVMKTIRSLDSMFNFAAFENLIPKNPIKGFRYRFDNSKEVVFISSAELEKIATTKYATDKLTHVADLFVFQCFTGLSYSDLKTISVDNITVNFGSNWLKFNRQKNGQLAQVPMLPEAESIWKKYNGNLPLLSNEKYNEYVKHIALVCGIEKHITTHVARKTFATLMLNEKGFSYKIVAAMLGHSNSRTTEQHYAKVQLESINNEVVRMIA